MQNNEEKAIATIARFNSEHGRDSDSDVMFVAKLKDIGLSNVGIASVIETLETVCKECFDSETPCYCWNDE